MSLVCDLQERADTNSLWAQLDAMLPQTSGAWFCFYATH
jgi:hypothetical protein